MTVPDNIPGFNFAVTHYSTSGAKWHPSFRINEQHLLCDMESVINNGNKGSLLP